VGAADDSRSDPDPAAAPLAECASAACVPFAAEVPYAVFLIVVAHQPAMLCSQIYVSPLIDRMLEGNLKQRRRLHCFQCGQQEGLGTRTARRVTTLAATSGCS
jgi:hypothetical protein